MPRSAALLDKRDENLHNDTLFWGQIWSFSSFPLQWWIMMRLEMRHLPRLSPLLIYLFRSSLFWLPAFTNPPVVNPHFLISILSPFFSPLPLRLSVGLFLLCCSHTRVQNRGAIRSRSLPSDLSLVTPSLWCDGVLTEAVWHRRIKSFCAGSLRPCSSGHIIYRHVSKPLRSHREWSTLSVISEIGLIWPAQCGAAEVDRERMEVCPLRLDFDFVNSLFP